MPEHLLDRTQVRSSLEQVSRKRVAEDVRMDARRVEPGLLGELAQDQERAGAGERAALRVQEQLGAVAAVEVRAPAREVAAERLGGVTADRHDPLLAALAGDPDETVVEIDPGALEPDRLRDT